MALRLDLLIAAAIASVPVVILVPSSRAPDPVAPYEDGGDGGNGDDTPLMLEMEKLEAAMDVLKRSVLDAAQDAKSLEQVVVAQQACLVAKQMQPKMAPSVADAERAAFRVAYRKGMAATLIELANLETALLDGDREKARALWKKLDGMKDDAHNEFTEGE